LILIRLRTGTNEKQKNRKADEKRQQKNDDEKVCNEMQINKKGGY
jgi:hypothetical protein